MPPLSAREGERLQRSKIAPSHDCWLIKTSKIKILFYSDFFIIVYTYIFLTVYTYDMVTVYTYGRRVDDMNKRSENMKKVNHLRSEVTRAMFDLLDELEEGTGGDYEGFDHWDIRGHKELKGQLNSYRAQKIAQFLGKNISKQKLFKYVKPKGYIYSLTNKDITDWLEDNRENLLKYSTFNIQIMTYGQRSR